MGPTPIYETILVNLEGDVATITLNRPAENNTINNQLIDDLLNILEKLKHFNELRVIIITGKGESFCSGADLGWVKDAADKEYSDTLAASKKLAELMNAIHSHPKAVIAKVNGNAFGGGVGLICSCDIAIAAEDSKFGFSEVRVGIVSAVIAPYILTRISEANCKRLFLTGERISAVKAADIGLVNKVVSLNKLTKTVEEITNLITLGGPEAVKNIKMLVNHISKKVNKEIQTYTSELITKSVKSPEGQEGLKAYSEKRKPNWVL